MAFSQLNVAALVLTATLLGGCRPQSPKQQEFPKPKPLEPGVPVGYQKIAPGPVDTAAGMLAQSSAVFRGKLTEVKFTYDQCAGPRTVYVFSDSSSVLGTGVGREVALKTLGGPTPKGTWIRVSELPHLALDSEYLIFLRNTDWTYSPIVGNLAFRIEKISGREVLIHPDGHALLGWNEDGPVLSTKQVTGLVGQDRHGYRSQANAPVGGQESNSGATDPRGVARPAAGPAPTPAPSQPPESPIVRAPSERDMRKAALFAKPAIYESSLSGETGISPDSFIANIQSFAEQKTIKLGGRFAPDPNWKCWSITPTVRVR
jgi:hypothetical protein